MLHASKYNFVMSSSKTNISGFIGEEPRRANVGVNDMCFEQVNSFVIWDVTLRFTVGRYRNNVINISAAPGDYHENFI